MAAEDRYVWIKEDLFGQLAGYGLLPRYGHIPISGDEKNCEQKK